MRVRSFILGGWMAGLTALGLAADTCRRGVLEGEVKAGEGFVRPIGNGLAVMVEPLASGWIVRVIPASGPRGDHDYAELATPPYHSVTPLLVSTDFAFRAQDAVGWNPRRFRFATSAAAFTTLRAAYVPFESPVAKPSPEQEHALGVQLARTSGGLFEILDAKLIGGTADQWLVAGAVASHFTTTAHTMEPPPGGKDMPLGKLLWVKFRIGLDLPPVADFKADRALKVEARACDLK